MKKKIAGAKTKLEKAVQAEINSHAEDYNESGAKGFLEDLAQGGCSSGMVGSLIYYKDTIPFYKKHKSEINAMLKEALSETGLKSPAELFGDKWDAEDIFAEETQNQNLLAWFGFEETARKLANDNGIEI
jgi:hypothetical protein